MEQLTAGLGTAWEIRRNTYKPFACGVVTHPAIDGLLRIRRKRPTSAAEVDEVQVHVHPRVLEICGNPEPRTGLEGKFSIYYCCAIALVDGAAGQAQFSDARVLDPALIELRQRVNVLASAGLRPEQAAVRLRFRDGSQLEERVDHALGTLENPLSDGDLNAKFCDLVGPVLGVERTKELLALTWQLEEVTTVQELTRLCRPQA